MSVLDVDIILPQFFIFFFFLILSAQMAQLCRTERMTVIGLQPQRLF